MRILIVGDIVGSPGRNCLFSLLPELKKEEKIDFVIVNAENAAGGVGVTPKIASTLLNAGVDVLTSGNHIWDKKEIYAYLDDEKRILRPGNYPPETTPGRGSGIYSSGQNKIAVLNIAGRVYMPIIDCPFRYALKEIEVLSKETKTIIVDFHAEATSEKKAMGWFLDGKVSAVIGTHTHVQTADARLLPGKTAYITDVGMTGAYDSILGVDTKPVIKKFLTQMPVRFNVSKSETLQFNAVIVDNDTETGLAKNIKPIYKLL
ncbi:MAG: TIGR00282 family metallophosphoesterase [Firmicutes bacterium]|nr:TIGR00282 family metallophosphoesterase [Bacillota bacterium]